MRGIIERLDEAIGKKKRPSSLADFQRSSAELTRKIGEAYNEALHLKGMMDEMEEVPNSLKKLYDDAMKSMSALGKLKATAYQHEMKLKRMKP